MTIPDKQGDLGRRGVIVFGDDDGMLREFCQQLPLGVTREDYSAVKRRLDRLLDDGVGDLRAYLSENSDVLFDLVRSIRHLDANDSQLKLFRVDSVQEYVDFTHNSEHRKMGGWAEFHARNIANLLDGKSRSVDYSDFAADGTPIKYSVIAWVPAGRESDWSVVISTHEDITEAKVSKSLGAVQNITDRTKIEETLRETQLLYRKAERMGKIGFWEWDSVEQKMSSCSEEYARIFGMSVDEALTHFSDLESDRQVIYPADRERYLHYDSVRDDTSSGTEIEYRIITLSGELRHVYEQSEVVLDDNGKHVKSFGTMQDITERVQAAERLRESHDLYKQAEELGKLGHWKWDIVNNKMDYCSEQFAKIYGMSVDEAMAFFSSTDSEREIVHPDDWERYLEHNREALERQEGFEFEYRIITKSGAVRHVHQLSKMVFDEGVYVGTIGTVRDITDRVIAEEKLRKSHALYGQAEELGKLGHWEWDSINKEMITCSEQFAEIYGMTVDEALVFFTNLDNDLELVHPDDREHYLQKNSESLDQKKGLDVEYRIITPAGELRHLHQVCQVVLDDEGRILRSFGTIQDITERVRAEQNLRQSHALFSQAEKIGKLGHWEWDSVNERMMSCSDQFANIFGMTVDETLEYFTSLKKDRNVIHPDDRERYLQNEYVLVDGSKRTDIEYRLITPLGELRHVHEQSQVVFDNNGKHIGSFGTIQDITERVQAEDRLRHSHALYSQAEKIGKLGHWEWDDVTNKLESCSEQFAQIYEMTVDEAIAVFTWEQELELIHREDRGRYEQHIIDTEEQGSGANIEYRIITAKGNVRHLHLQSQIETDDQNRVIRSFGTVQDVSDRVRLESERNRLAEQLLQGQKMESLGVLAGGIAHDFNNILSAVLGYATLAQDEAKGEDLISEYLQQIVKSGERARDLTQQILAFSRQTDVTSHPMDVVSVIHEVISLLQATVPANMFFEQSLDSGCGTILANQTAVHQLLMNLCTNAVHAMEPNGGRITITARMAKQTELPAELDSSAAPGWLRIGVADTGAGIPEDILDMIFDPFFTTKEVGHGTGMGLAAVHGIVSKLGGVIQVSSDVGSGTQFEVFLPTTVDPATTSALDRQKTVQGKANILFIDDEESLVNLAKIQLERLGYTVDAFSNPVEAIASAAADPGRYDVLITDFSMPGMTGLKAASKFTELNPGLPVLLMTGLDPDISDDELAAAGIRKTLIKPYSMADLSRAIRESLG